jgi:Phosphotransferase enzyme family
MKRTREEQLESDVEDAKNKIESLKKEIESLKKERNEWKQKAEQAKDDEEAAKFLKRYDTINEQITEKEKQITEDMKQIAEKEKQLTLFLEETLQKKRKEEEGNFLMPSVRNDLEVFLPPFVETPSSASEKALRGKVREGSASIHGCAFNALRVFEDTNYKTVSQETKEIARSLLDFLNRLVGQEEKGLFGVSFRPSGELARTAVLSCELERLVPKTFGEATLHWFHQLPDPKNGKMDIALYVSKDGGPLLAVGVIEVGFKGDKKKNWQAEAYTVNITRHLTEAKQSLFSLELLLDRHSTEHEATLNYHSISNNQNNKALWKSVVWSGKVTQEATSKLLHVMVETADDTIKIHPLPALQRIGGNISFDAERKTFVKVFDYRYRKVEEQQQRNHELALKYLKAEVLLEVNDLVVIEYPAINGTHGAKRVEQMIHVVDQLQKLHESNLCHGDIRGYNVLFNEGTSCLIDFDFAGVCGKKQYPEGYIVDIPDGKRHEGAKGGEFLQKIHDCFALAAVMKLRECKDAKFKDCVKLVEEGKLTEALKSLKSFSDAVLEPNIVLTGATGHATGSPDRVKGK